MLDHTKSPGFRSKRACPIPCGQCTFTPLPVIFPFLALTLLPALPCSNPAPRSPRKAAGRRAAQRSRRRTAAPAARGNALAGTGVTRDYSPKASGYSRKPFSTHRHLESLPRPFLHFPGSANFTASHRLRRAGSVDAAGCGAAAIHPPALGWGRWRGRAENTGMRFLLGVCWRMKEVCRANEALPRMARQLQPSMPLHGLQV